MDNQGDVKMETVPSSGAATSAAETHTKIKTTTMVMPTGPAPIISNKHPVMHLNELTKDSKFELVSEDKEVDPKNKRHRVFTMLLSVNGEQFQGVGPSKKVAREEAAKYALLKLFNFLYIPDASFGAFVPEGTVLGKRVGDSASPESAGQPGSKKKKKKQAQEGPKNPVMRLNELRSGLDYVVESQTGPVHAPVFVMSLVVDGLKYEGCGNSKKKAKIDVATKALNAIEPQQVEQSMKCEPSTTT